MTLFKVLSRNISRLQKSGSQEAALDVSLIVAHVLGLKRAQLGTRYEKKVSLRQRWTIYNKVSQRIKHRPVAHILGHRDFYRDRFVVSSRSLIPRADSEHILYILEELQRQGMQADRILDLGTGTGVLALSARHIYPRALIDALDIDTRLVKINRRLLSVDNVEIIQADMLDWDNPGNKQYDVILANPPYLNEGDMKKLDREVRVYEPTRALQGGADGLLFYRDIAGRYFQWMRQGAMLLLEVDYKWQQIRDLFHQDHWEMIEIRKDYAGLARVLVMKKL